MGHAGLKQPRPLFPWTVVPLEDSVLSQGSGKLQPQKGPGKHPRGTGAGRGPDGPSSGHQLREGSTQDAPCRVPMQHAAAAAARSAVRTPCPVCPHSRWHGSGLLPAWTARLLGTRRALPQPPAGSQDDASDPTPASYHHVPTKVTWNCWLGPPAR